MLIDQSGCSDIACNERNDGMCAQRAVASTTAEGQGGSTKQIIWFRQRHVAIWQSWTVRVWRLCLP